MRERQLNDQQRDGDPPEAAKTAKNYRAQEKRGGDHQSPAVVLQKIKRIVQHHGFPRDDARRQMIRQVLHDRTELVNGVSP